MRKIIWILFAIAVSCTSAVKMASADHRPEQAKVASIQSSCLHCAEWNQTQKPFQIYGNTYFVGVHGLSSVLVTSKDGHILIDGALNESAPKIIENIRSIGFRIEDIKFILNSHVHDDHAGGIAELQRLSGAVVAVSESSAQVLKSGMPSLDDPQHDIAHPITPVSNIRAIADQEMLKLGALAIVAHFTPGHTPGGTSWTWKSCQKGKCLNLAYVDSLTAVSGDDFRFSDSPTYPSVRADFKKTFDVVASLPCDILVTPHPDFSDLFERLEKREHGQSRAFIDRTACRRLADRSRTNFSKRLAKEAEKTLKSN